MQDKNEYFIAEMPQTQSLETDTLKGLSSAPKYLLPKYLYDDEGSFLFQEITKMPEYYLTKIEQEILESRKDNITNAIISDDSSIDLIELGSGDGSKTKILLKLLLQKRVDLNYIPVDISSKANEDLISDLKKDLPDLKISPLTGDFFGLTGSGNIYGNKRKVILFLGSNIGNFTEPELNLFLKRLFYLCRKGDRILIGFDLKKSPEIIMNAYDDPYGLTRKFNLNHLVRLNRELEADFNIYGFEHHTSYNPVTGYLKSYLVSKDSQAVTIKSMEKQFIFERWEPVFMEQSRKFDFATIEYLANSYGFSVVRHFTDRKSWFTDSLWNKT